MQVFSPTGGKLEELPIDTKPYIVFGRLPDNSDITLVQYQNTLLLTLMGFSAEGGYAEHHSVCSLTARARASTLLWCITRTAACT